MSRWFRSYDEALDDPKVQRLSDALFRAWFNLMCVTSKNKGEPFTIEEVEFRLRLTSTKAKATLAGLIDAGLIDEKDGRYISHNWASRQFKSDVSNERVKRHRQRHCNVTSDVIVTPPEPDQNQNTEQIDSFQGLGRKRNGWSPPKHGAFHKGKGLVYIREGTPEWDAHASDYATVHFEKPKPDKGGGYWFKMKGEAA